jgi:hypothetical protein
MKERRFESAKDLKRGDIVKHKIHWESYVVDAVHEDSATAVRTLHLTNPSEWVIVERE